MTKCGYETQNCSLSEARTHYETRCTSDVVNITLTIVVGKLDMDDDEGGLSVT